MGSLPHRNRYSSNPRRPPPPPEPTPGPVVREFVGNTYGGVRGHFDPNDAGRQAVSKPRVIEARPATDARIRPSAAEERKAGDLPFGYYAAAWLAAMDVKVALGRLEERTADDHRRTVEPLRALRVERSDYQRDCVVGAGDFVPWTSPHSHAKRAGNGATFVDRCAPSGTRTHTWRILSPLPLPIGLWGPTTGPTPVATTVELRTV